jgi:hypothetical protein
MMPVDFDRDMEEKAFADIFVFSPAHAPRMRIGRLRRAMTL